MSNNEVPEQFFSFLPISGLQPSCAIQALKFIDSIDRYQVKHGEPSVLRAIPSCMKNRTAQKWLEGLIFCKGNLKPTLSDIRYALLFDFGVDDAEDIWERYDIGARSNYFLESQQFQYRCSYMEEIEQLREKNRQLEKELNEVAQEEKDAFSNTQEWPDSDPYSSSGNSVDGARTPTSTVVPPPPRQNLLRIKFADPRGRRFPANVRNEDLSNVFPYDHMIPWWLFADGFILPKSGGDMAYGEIVPFLREAMNFINPNTFQLDDFRNIRFFHAETGALVTPAVWGIIAGETDTLVAKFRV
ncbi:hypothetical protein RUND412_001873 [Rhizina undulata]